MLRAMHRTLPQLKKALKGLVTMSQELEAMADALFVAAIPAVWSELAYPSLKALGPWVDELMNRLDFLYDWIDSGIPTSFWVPGFYFPQAFFTGARQNYARKHECAIDKVDFNFIWRKEIDGKSEISEGPEDGVYIYGLGWRVLGGMLKYIVSMIRYQNSYTPKLLLSTWIRCRIGQNKQQESIAYQCIRHFYGVVPCRQQAIQQILSCGLNVPAIAK